MLTSLEIAKILRDQKKKQSEQKSGIDSGLMGLGVARALGDKAKKK